MAAQQSARPNNHLLNAQSALLALALIMPGIAPNLFGWLSGLLATPIVCLLCINGQKKGLLLIRNGVLLAVAAAIILKLLPSLLFALTMVPLGYSFSKSYAEKNTEIHAGTRGTIILAATWFVFWGIYGAALDINPYQQLLEMLDTGFAQTSKYYMTNADMPAESVIQIEQAVNELRGIIPVILPGLLSCTVLITVWINLVLSTTMLARLQPEQTPWKKYSDWRLPDKLVWVLIVAGIVLLISSNMSQAALTIFISTALLYFFQGLAVFIFLLEKWNVPLYLRILIYGILIIQSYGLILLTLVGLAEVWFNFRRPQTTDNTNL